MDIRLEDNILYITPNSLKNKILEYLSRIDQLYDISFMSLESLKEKYYFKVKDEALLYLLEKMDENIDVLKLMIRNLYQIDLNANYKHKKLQKLQAILKDLKDNDYLVYDDGFIDYLKNKKIYVLGYPMLNPYEEVMLSDIGAVKLEIDSKYKLDRVYKYNDLKDEVIAVATKIRKLNEDGVSYNKIFLAGIDANYTYVLENVFRMFDIPIYYKSNRPLFSLIPVKNYLVCKDINVIKNEELKKKIIRIEESISYFKDTSYYDILLEKELKNNSLSIDIPLECVKIVNEALDVPYLIGDDEYLFVLSFNQNILPKIYKDEEYLTDMAKKEVMMLSSLDKNKISKENLVDVLSTVKNLEVSYKLTSLTGEYAKSSLINEMNLEEVEDNNFNYKYSHNFNNYSLASSLDQYYKFHSKTKDFDYLITNIDSTLYNNFNHKYKKINREDKDLVLSYSNFNDYALCPFRYYLKHVLKLDEFTKTFNQKIGNIFHYVLNDSYNDNFDFETSFDKATCSEELDNRELFLLKRLKEELKFIVINNKIEEENTALTSFFGEKRVEVRLSEAAILKGFIDKILYKNKNGKDYYAVFDYKTGNVNLNFNYIENGLYMQLPIYIYLIEKSNIFSNPVFAGSYYQTLLSNALEEEEKKKNLRLKGYSASEEETLEYLDVNYKSSTWIKSLSYTKSDKLSSRSKVLSSDEIKEMVDKVDKVLKDTVSGIHNNLFTIRPVIINNKNISCEFCPYKEICFHDVTDNKYIDTFEEEVV